VRSENARRPRSRRTEDCRAPADDVKIPRKFVCRPRFFSPVSGTSTSQGAWASTTGKIDFVLSQQDEAAEGTSSQLKSKDTMAGFVGPSGLMRVLARSAALPVFNRPVLLKASIRFKSSSSIKKVTGVEGSGMEDIGPILPVIVDPAFWNGAGVPSGRLKSQPVVARELELDQIAEGFHSRSVFDKTLILINHPERELRPDRLTRRGVGQALNLSRTACTYCNDGTGFLPELVLVSPTRCSVETAFLTLPQFSPHSVRAVPWVCHEAVTSTIEVMRDLTNIQRGYGDLEFAWYHRDSLESSTTVEDLFRRANVLLNWMRTRPERVIVGTYLVELRR